MQQIQGLANVIQQPTLPSQNIVTPILPSQNILIPTQILPTNQTTIQLTAKEMKAQNIVSNQQSAYKIAEQQIFDQLNNTTGTPLSKVALCLQLCIAQSENLLSFIKSNGETKMQQVINSTVLYLTQNQCTIDDLSLAIISELAYQRMYINLQTGNDGSQKLFFKTTKVIINNQFFNFGIDVVQTVFPITKIPLNIAIGCLKSCME